MDVIKGIRMLNEVSHFYFSNLSVMNHKVQMTSLKKTSLSMNMIKSKSNKNMYKHFEISWINV